MKPKHPAGLPMTQGNMSEFGVQKLIVFCLSDACHLTALPACRGIGLRARCRRLGSIVGCLAPRPVLDRIPMRNLRMVVSNQSEVCAYCLVS
jgi:hypothetical protein